MSNEFGEDTLGLLLVGQFGSLGGDGASAEDSDKEQNEGLLMNKAPWRTTQGPPHARQAEHVSG